MMMHVAPLERRTDFGAQDSILVGFGDGVIPRMKIFGSFGGFRHANLARQRAVHGFPQIFDRNGIGK